MVNQKKSRKIFYDWSKKSKGIFTGLIIPNVFGPFSKPNYNSVIATFCYNLNNKKNVKVDIDNKLNLIYVDDLVNNILNIIDNKINDHSYVISHSTTKKVSEILNILQNLKMTIYWTEKFQILVVSLILIYLILLDHI